VLRLDGTELVVMSACQTGVGKVENGEGIYGLRRAFTQAGAHALVMSMWVVPDRETLELMVEFYKNLKTGKLNRAQALRQAMLKQKAVTIKRYGQANPLFWGSFVFLGQP
jgi:CHAT domain-containing protein